MLIDCRDTRASIKSMLANNCEWRDALWCVVVAVAALASQTND